MIMEVKKSHGLLCARWKFRKAGDITQSEPRGLMAKGANVVNPGQAWKSKNQENPMS